MLPLPPLLLLLLCFICIRLMHLYLNVSLCTRYICSSGGTRKTLAQSYTIKRERAAHCTFQGHQEKQRQRERERARWHRGERVQFAHEILHPVYRELHWRLPSSGRDVKTFKRNNCPRENWWHMHTSIARDNETDRHTHTHTKDHLLSIFRFVCQWDARRCSHPVSWSKWQQSHRHGQQ